MSETKSIIYSIRTAIKYRDHSQLPAESLLFRVRDGEAGGRPWPAIAVV